MESIWITRKRLWKSIFYVWFTQRSSSKNSIWQRAKKPRRSPWSRKDEDCSHKWRQTKSRHNSNADVCEKAVDLESVNTGGNSAQIDKFHTPHSFLCCTRRFKNQVTTCSDFPFEAMWWIKEVEMVDSLDGLKSSRSVLGENFQTLKCWTRRLLLHWKRSSKLPLQEEGQSRGAESPERGPVSTRKTDCLHDLRLFSSDWRSWHSIGLCWFILCYS